MSFFDKPIAGLRPADSITISLATGIAVSAIYGADIGPIADVHATTPGDASINSAIKKAGWKSLLLVAGLTLLTRDLNVVYIGGTMIIAEHVMYLHADMASPSAGGTIQASPAAYQPAGGAQLAAVS
ncbi:MAG TPA: hypothetical protein VGG25_31170 [Streptosporangiaceae bacterium]|jgi:hypothetical protein